MVQLGAVPDIRRSTRLADYWATRRRRWGVNRGLLPALLSLHLQCLPRKLPVCANFTRIFTVFWNLLLLIPRRALFLSRGEEGNIVFIRFFSIRLLNALGTRLSKYWNWKFFDILFISPSVFEFKRGRLWLIFLFYFLLFLSSYVYRLSSYIELIFLYFFFTGQTF